MKNLCLILWVFVAGMGLFGCSDDGVYTPIEAPADAGPEVAQACVEKGDCPDAGK